ncbi:MAG: hypothetical protein NTX19_04310 [Gemmatimonadetes bacterium]|nr:hypothetical protein [Gemmatimonadota bacterium]
MAAEFGATSHEVDRIGIFDEDDQVRDARIDESDLGLTGFARDSGVRFQAVGWLKIDLGFIRNKPARNQARISREAESIRLGKAELDGQPGAAERRVPAKLATAPISVEVTDAKLLCHSGFDHYDPVCSNSLCPGAQAADRLGSLERGHSGCPAVEKHEVIAGARHFPELAALCQVSRTHG